MVYNKVEWNVTINTNKLYLLLALMIEKVGYDILREICIICFYL